MREILFRGKQKYGSRWVYGYLAEIETAWDRYEYGSLPTEYEEVIIRTDLLIRESVAIIPETVGQYTGLEDKNGKKIFEGDIVKDKWKGLGIVEYSENNGCWLSIPCEDGLYQCFKDGDISESDCSNFNVLMQQGEIIGNIHDNPELLREE